MTKNHICFLLTGRVLKAAQTMEHEITGLILVISIVMARKLVGFAVDSDLALEKQLKSVVI